MDNQDLISRFNRGLRCSFHRFPLIIAFISLIGSAFCYEVATAPYSFMRSHWNFFCFQGMAFGLCAFWIFLGMALICRYSLAMSHHQRPQIQKVMASLPALAKSAISVCFVFVVGSFALWIALGVKHYLIQVTHLGLAVSILFAWLPFVLFLLLKLAPLLIGALLFLVVPIIAVQQMPIYRALVQVIVLFKKQPVPTILCVISGTLPLILTAWLISSLQKHTMVYLGGDDPYWVISMRKLVLAITSTFFMAPAVSILSCLGFESIQWLQKITDGFEEAVKKNARDYKGF